MNEIEARVLKAKQNKKELESFLKDYLPFLKKLAGSFTGQGIEYDDLLSISMLTFANCVTQYQPGKGGFLPFVQISVRNRLIDELRKENKYRYHLSFSTQQDGTLREQAEDTSMKNYNLQQERENLHEEINSLHKELSIYGITFRELSKHSPRQKKARILALRLAKAVFMKEDWKNQLIQQKRLPQKELAERFSISVKTIEKHRKYIVALFLLLSGEYPHIRAFLPKTEEVDA